MNTMLEGGLLMMLTLPLLIAVLLATDIIAGCRADAPTVGRGPTRAQNGSQSTLFSSRSCCLSSLHAGRLAGPSLRWNRSAVDSDSSQPLSMHLERTAAHGHQRISVSVVQPH